jgi:hypothetical protein
MSKIATIAALLLATTTQAAQQPGQQEPNVPVNTYRGFAHADCNTAGAPVVRIVLPAGSTPIPTTLPKSSPRPAVELVVQGMLDAAVGKPIPVQEPLVDGALAVSALSCPVVGSCSRARTGTMSFDRRSENNTLIGEFRIRWPDEAARSTDVIGKFTAVWFDSGGNCK